MAYQDSKRYKLVNKKSIFAGGYVDNTAQIDMAPEFSPYLRNARLDGQSITIRPGHDLFATLDTTTDYPRAIGSYLRANPTNNRLVVRHNVSGTEKLVSLTNAGVATNINTGANISSNNKMRFLNVADVLYCMNGSDNYGKLSGTTYTAPATGIASFAPSFGVIFNSCVRASGWSTNSNKVYKSVADNYEDFSGAGSDEFTFQEQITGLSANSEALFYFTKNTISVTGFQDITDTSGTITYVTRPLIVKEGAVNHDCIVEVGAKTYYLSTSNTINMIARGNNINGFEVVELSDRPYAGITKLMGSLAKDQSNAFAVYYPNEMLIKWHLYSQGSTFADIVVIYDTVHDAFLIDEQKYFTDGVFFEGYNYTTSAIEAKVYRDEYGQTDEDQPIPFEYWTKEHYLGDATNKKIIWESRTLVDINELAGLEQTIRVDGGQVDEKTVDQDNIPLLTGGIGTYEIGESEIGTEGGQEEGDDMYEVTILRTKGNLNVKGKKIQRRFTNNTQAGKVRLKSVDVKVEGLPELATNLTQ